jgi:hypothetical protein
MDVRAQVRDFARRYIAESQGHYDQAEYDRQLQHGVGSE